VNIANHSGWTGNVHTSWKGLNQHVSGCGPRNGIGGVGRTSDSANKDDSSALGKSHSGLTPNNANEIHGGSLYNGDRWVLYWSDVTSEIAFVVPTGKSANWSETAVWNLSESVPSQAHFDPNSSSSAQGLEYPGNTAWLGCT
jgi:hypothetical protein